MANDLFRDLLDGRIMVRKTVRPCVTGMWIAPAGTPLNTSSMTGWIDVSSLLTTDGLSLDPYPHWSPADGWDDWGATSPPPADPRARALQHKQHQHHGPKDAPLRTRGRNNRYQTKG